MKIYEVWIVVSTADDTLFSGVTDEDIEPLAVFASRQKAREWLAATDNDVPAKIMRAEITAWRQKEPKP